MTDDRWAMADGRWPMNSFTALAWNLKQIFRMSKQNNVNPGQYKVGGRLRPGDDKTERQEAKAQASIADHELREKSRRTQKKEQ